MTRTVLQIFTGIILIITGIFLLLLSTYSIILSKLYKLNEIPIVKDLTFNGNNDILNILANDKVYCIGIPCSIFLLIMFFYSRTISITYFKRQD